MRKLKIIPAQVVVVEQRCYAYACRNFDQNGIETLVTAPNGRQELKRQGITFSSQTMSNWILRAAADYLTPVYNALHREFLCREVLYADETTLQVLHEPGKRPQSESYMWLHRTSGISTASTEDRPIVWYEYQSGRGAKHPAAFLEDFRGYPHADGYAGYHKLLEEITVVGCWAHALRNFDEALKSIAKGHASAKNIRKGLDFCNRLFTIEQKLANLPAEERYNQRLEQAKPVLDELFRWLNQFTTRPSSPGATRWNI